MTTEIIHFSDHSSYLNDFYKLDPNLKWNDVEKEFIPNISEKAEEIVFFGDIKKAEQVAKICGSFYKHIYELNSDPMGDLNKFKIHIIVSKKEVDEKINELFKNADG